MNTLTQKERMKLKKEQRAKEEFEMMRQAALLAHEKNAQAK